ncbi:hypothetical protein [Falsiroseomonas sp.]|uniref:hypothetical protein n=1 Tax=Falsiroseomonas sp. TaxID=2870721 RepID=UPI003F724D98
MMRLVRLLRAGAALASLRNIGKGLRRIARGEIGLLFFSLRNLMAQRVALAQVAGPIGMESFEPLPDMPDVPLVSIVIPCFNDGALVGGAVASALAQTFTDI